MSNPNNKPKILIVDDQLDVLDTLRLIVNPAKWQIHIAHSALEAAHILEEMPDFDTVVTDYHMPDGTGEQVRRVAQSKGIKVFLHTSDVTRFSTQFDRCFDKFDRELLRFLKTGAFEGVQAL